MRISVLRPAALALMRARPIELDGDPRLAGRTLTVDAFDTLITRSVLQPADVFVLAGLSMRDRGIIAMEPAAWGTLRHQAEADLGHRLHPREVTRDEIFQELVRLGALTEGDCEAANGLERDVEALVSRPVAEMVALVNAFARQGRTVEVLSDTPMPGGDVWNLLRNAGLDLTRDAITASSDSGLTKRSGALFNATKRRMAAQPRTILHVGDNFQADVRQAFAAGLRPAPYLTSRPNRYETLLGGLLPQAGCLASIMAGSARATRLGGVFPTRQERAIWDTSADVIGPLLFAFVAWILREARARKLRTIYFFARDGEILMRVARELQPTVAPDIDCRYLSVSRRSLHLPGVTALREPERAWILDNATSHDLDYLLARLDLTREAFLAVLAPDSPLRECAPDRPLTGADVTAIEGALDLPVVRQLIFDRASQRRANCLAYMRQEGLLKSGAFAVVDIGWRGRLQRSLCRVLETAEPGIARRMHGFYIDLAARPDDAGSFDTFSALYPSAKFSWVARGPLFEVFCAARHGTTVGYRVDADGSASPVLAADDNPEADRWGLALQQAGVTALAREAAHGMELARLDPTQHVEAMARAACEIMRLFVGRPSPREAEAYGRFSHTENEAHDQPEEMAGVIDFRPDALVRRLGPKYRNRRISFWPEASVVRSVPSWLRTGALSLLGAMRGLRS